MNTSDLELLARYSRQGAEDAFAEIVRRHAGLVYAVALRVTRTRQLAEDVTQAVFLELARNSKKLRPDTVLAAWLYSVTRRIAANTVRGETRRLAREHAAYAMNAAKENVPPPAELEPLLDDAIDALAQTDRAAIVLRFFEEKSLADVGAALGVSADAAQKRVSRAVEQMRGFFTHRGIATGTVAITALLAANTAKAVPAGLAASICATVHTSIPLTTATLIKAATMTTIQKSLVGLTLVAVVGVAVRQTNEVSQLRGQVKALQSSAHKTSSVPEENADSTPDRTSTRTVTAKTRTKPTRAQLEAKLLSLAELGVTKFGRANMNRIIADVSVEDIPGLLALVDEKVAPELRERFHESWIDLWAAADAPAAFAYAVALKNGLFVDPNKLSSSPLAIGSSLPNARGSALDSVFANWVDQDPAGAVKALEAYTGPNKEDAGNSLANAWVEKDPRAALEWVLGDANGHSANPYVMAERWGDMAPTEAWKWALALPDGGVKSRILNSLAGEAAEVSPVEVANEVAKMEPGLDQGSAAISTATSWAKTDPRAASEWVAQFPDSEFRNSAMNGIARNWASKDPAAARTWVQSLPPGNAQQEAWWGVTRGLAASHPEQATETVKNLTDTARRNWAISDIGENWFRKDPAAARQWLQSVGLPEERIQRIQKDSVGR